MTNDTLGVIRSLTSTHWTFNDKRVSRDTIEAIVEHSMHAANNNDRTDISVIVVDDAETLNTISGGDSGGKSVTTLIYALDYTRVMRCARALGYDKYDWPRYRLYHLLFGLHDVCAAAQTAVIAAKAMGVDALVTNFIHRNDPERTRKLLGMPEEYCFPVIQLALGYTDGGPQRKPRQISVKPIIHYGQYRELDDEDIQAVISDMDANYPQYINEKYTHAMDWFFNEWWIEHYQEDAYKDLADAFTRSKILSAL